jgi:hypothetical protein
VWRRVVFPLSLVAAVTAAAIAASSLSAASATPTASVEKAKRFLGGPFYSIGCSFSHRNNDDPIVFPGQPGRSHNHTFLGNTTVDAWATPRSLRGGPTSCEDAGDSSGYWVPSLYVGRTAVHPEAANVYYVKRAKTRIATLPKGLVMIAGNAAAHSPQPKRVVSWRCGNVIGAGPASVHIPSCSVQERLQLQVAFPSCWNGRTPDSVDHKRHMKYLSKGRCPRSHPVALPTLVLVVLYRPVPLGAQVASGHFGAHADFMNGWTDDVLTRFYIPTPSNPSGSIAR